MKILGALIAGSAFAEECFLPIDMMFLQDTTGSFVDDLPNVSHQIPGIINAVTGRHPGSYFGISQFRDKPYRDLGEPSDFCYKLDQPLTTNISTFKASWDTLFASGGGDLPEVQLQALINVATDGAVQWRTINNAAHAVSDKYVGAKLILLSTDAVPHDPLDYELYHEEPLPQPPLPPAFMPPFPNDLTGISPSTQCTTYDYPSMEQAAKVLKDNDVMVVFLVPQDQDNDAVAAWKRFNEEYLHQPADFVQFIHSDSSNIKDVVLKAVEAVSEYVCNTTPAPTATGAETTTTTTYTTPTPTTTTTTTSTTTATTTPTPTTAETTTTCTTTPTTTTTTTSTTTVETTTTTATTTTPTTTTTETTTTATTPTTTTSNTTETVTTETVTTSSTPTTTTPTTTTVTETTAPTTTPTADVTTAGSPQTTTGDHCDCGQHPGECPCVPSVVIRVNNRPKHLSVDYEK